MSTEYYENNPLKRARTIADFQFGEGIGERLFPENVEFRFSSTGRIRYILLGGNRLATLRAGDGRLTLSIDGAERLMQAVPPPRYRVTIADEVAGFVAAGKNAMAKHVTAADPEIRVGEEVLVVSGDALCATGTALLSGREMLAFNYGVAVQIRKGRT
ncbi:MAG: pseudouridine synthase [Methanomicrobiales archaeon]|nr:pseudouridine synthase [Methanomicrobiales archaeon]